MMEQPLIKMDDARTYAIPISNLIGLRLNRISVLNQRLKKQILKLYGIPSNENKDEICNSIRDLIIEIEKLVSKNIEDSQILEYAIAENSKPVTFIPTEPVLPTNDCEHHTYIQ